MLSILVPTYNYNVYPLIENLQKLALLLNINFEIICIDDGSNSDLNYENLKINSLANCRFIINQKNIGLSRNRNKLADESQYDNLLFIDGDSQIISKDYLINFIKDLESGYDVIYGGRIHPKTVVQERSLRWKYGIQREDKDASSRTKNPYLNTLFNNTLVKKKVFEKVSFNKNIIQYGHEDTLFAYELMLHKIKLKHIDNPILHGDVDFNDVFVEKTKKALENLNTLYTTQIIDPNFVTFLKTFEKMKKFGLHHPLAITYKIGHTRLLKNLISEQPSLTIFNFYRISYFCHINLNSL